MKEKFKDIPWYEWKYAISNLGRVKSLKRKKWFLIEWEKFLKPFINTYLYYDLYKDNKKTKKAMHRLIAESFIWNIEWKVVCHKDDNPLNNNIDNLFIWTQKDNLQDMSNKWRSYNQWKFWKHHDLSKKVNQYTLSWKHIKLWHALRDIERELNINVSSISSCCHWRYKTAWWFIFKFV